MAGKKIPAKTISFRIDYHGFIRIRTFNLPVLNGRELFTPSGSPGGRYFTSKKCHFFTEKWRRALGVSGGKICGRWLRKRGNNRKLWQGILQGSRFLRTGSTPPDPPIALHRFS
jgi:hypothetical protein